MATNPAQSRYLADTVSTATPAQLVVMLYDRLGLDLSRAGQAMAAADRFGIAENLLHAQQILAELLSSLRQDEWDGAGDLASIYAFLIRELVGIRAEQNVAKLAACAEIVRNLRATWQQAAIVLAAETTERGAASSRTGAWVA